MILPVITLNESSKKGADLLSPNPLLRLRWEERENGHHFQSHPSSTVTLDRRSMLLLQDASEAVLNL
jgi:hypothetical protein